VLLFVQISSTIQLRFIVSNNHLKFTYLRVLFGLYFIALMFQFFFAKNFLFNPLFSIERWREIPSPFLSMVGAIHFEIFWAGGLLAGILFTAGLIPQACAFVMYAYLCCLLNDNLYLVEIHSFFLMWALLGFTFYPTNKNIREVNFSKIFTKVSWLVFIFSMGMLGLAKLFYDKHYFSADVAKFLFHLKDARLHYDNFLYPYLASMFDVLPSWMQTLLSTASALFEFLVLPLGLFKKTKPVAIVLSVCVFLFIGVVMNYMNIAIAMFLFMLLGLDFSNREERYFY
jgi:hypothetical protein